MNATQEEAAPQEKRVHKMWARVYWALAGLVLFASVPALLLARSPAQTFMVIGSLAVILVVAVWVAEAVMAPIYTLRRRLEVKNYGEIPQEPPPRRDVDLGSGGFELGEMIASLAAPRVVDVHAALPTELADIEKLSRAGRASEVALASLRRDLVRGMAHQLKSPLAVVREHAAAAERALVEAGGESERGAAARRSLQSIQGMSLSMSDLVTQMLSLAWLEGLEEKGLVTQRANLSAIMMEVAASREHKAAQKGMRIDTRVEAGLWVRGQHQLLAEMVTALVDNAIRYSPENTRVHLECVGLQHARAVVMTVTDRGPGIPAHERERVFEPFYGSLGPDERGNMTYGSRRHRSLDAGGQRISHGLGLSLVRSVVRLHGATIKLEAGPGRVGLAASVTFSACKPPSEDDEAGDA